MKINYKLEYNIPSCKKFIGYIDDNFDNIFQYYNYKFGGNYIIIRKENNKWFDVTNDYIGKIIMATINKMEDKR